MSDPWGGASTQAPCGPWPVDTDCCSLPEGDHDDALVKHSYVATDLLWAESGRVYGVCAITVRPCLRRCADVDFGGASVLRPYMDSNGAWRNLTSCACGAECSCTELCEVVLEGPVASIEEVWIDGVKLEAGYRLDRVGKQWRLVRVDGSCWPDCQDMDAEHNEAGAFSIIYKQGVALPPLAIAAHSELTCELVKACIPGCKTCRIPANIARKVKSGVTLDYHDTSWIRTLPLVDAFLKAANPLGLARPLRVASPEHRGTRRAT